MSVLWIFQGNCSHCNWWNILGQYQLSHTKARICSSVFLSYNTENKNILLLQNILLVCAKGHISLRACFLWLFPQINIFFYITIFQCDCSNPIVPLLSIVNIYTAASLAEFTLEVRQNKKITCKLSTFGHWDTISIDHNDATFMATFQSTNTLHLFDPFVLMLKISVSLWITFCNATCKVFGFFNQGPKNLVPLNKTSNNLTRRTGALRFYFSTVAVINCSGASKNLYCGVCKELSCHSKQVLNPCIYIAIANMSWWYIFSL